ncbi:RnfABCDGE type electron transport complex subunit D [Terrilactibacillus laevilacticus]|uniref:RnfABCDGE type electron transport complex subunit D n=1 Tax=Terrilactibacillus laevilacticus TaxID=1380157 RepID=A0ABW5PSG3_9BACI|nr:RnfABCDGE type electron transport complex subunit D [Terrilactibacillus laevilacticus]
MQINNEKSSEIQNHRSRVTSRNDKEENVMVKLKKMTKAPKRFLIASLILLMLVGSFHSEPLSGIVTVLIAVASSVMVDLIFTISHKRKIKFPDGALLTGLIIGLVLSPTSPIYVTILTAIIAIVAKHNIKKKYKPIFNPAAFGLLISASFFSSGQSWWGGLTLLPGWSVILVVIIGYFVANRVNKFPQVFSFLGIYFLILLVFTFLNSQYAELVIRSPYINSTIFLAFFMLTDPPTSPAKYRDQIIFGAIAATTSWVSYFVFGGLTFLLIGLLISNGWSYWTSYLNKSKKRVAIG